MQKKSNDTFALLSALGIIFVVDLHSWRPMGLMYNIFPYNSFFMPMFVFISGYFFKENYIEKPFSFILKKLKRLIIPYLLINLVYICGIILVRKIYPDVEWDYGFNILTTGVDSRLTTPAWFVPSLFFVTITYFILRLIFRKWNHTAAFIIFAVLGAFCVFIAQTELNNSYTVLLLKVGFLIQFYEFGGLYKKYAEAKFKTMSKVGIMIVCFTINSLLILFTNENIDYKDMYAMTGFSTGFYLLPLITFFTGTAFWLSFAELLSPAVKNSRIIGFISKHTFGIMFNHLLFFLLLDLIIMVIPYSSDQFNYKIFFVNAGWYKADYIDGIRIWYFIFGMAGSMLLCFFFDRINKSKCKIIVGIK